MNFKVIQIKWGDIFSNQDKKLQKSAILNFSLNKRFAASLNKTVLPLHQLLFGGLVHVGHPEVHVVSSVHGVGQ